MNGPEPMAAFVSAPTVPTTHLFPLDRFQPYVLSILRFMAALLFCEHGMAKLFGFPPHGQMPGFMEIRVVCPHDRTDRRRAARARVAQPRRGLDHVGRNGDRLFH